ncbi:MAG: hypothetical protein NTW21_13380 [Verrucomicrobia bacterium]|nr:hypothetical protein [Verrucomicrobiota bacterium]
MQNRRDILRGCLRGGGLLALAGLASALGWRSLHGKCLRADPCGGCPGFSGCGLPKAMQSKRAGTAHPTAARSNTKNASQHARRPA